MLFRASTICGGSLGDREWICGRLVLLPCLLNELKSCSIVFYRVTSEAEWGMNDPIIWD